MSLIIVVPDNSPDVPSFITAHYKYIVGCQDLLYGGTPPYLSFNKDRQVYLSFFDRVYIKFFKIDWKLFLFKKYLIKYKVKKILVEYGPAGVEIIEVCKQLDIKIYVHFHGYDAYEFNTISAFALKYKILFEYCSKCFAVSKDMVSKLIALGANPKKLIYTPCGPDSIFEKISPNFESNVFLAVGRFVEKKAPVLTILAFEKVLKSNPQSKLIMIGDGPLLGISISLVKSLGIAKSVSFVTKVLNFELPNIIKDSFCFVQHSIVASNGDSEGTPVSIMEASLAGLPVISTRHMGINDVIIHGQTGYLVHEYDIENMSNYMIELLNNKELAKKMGDLGRKNISSNFSINHHIAILEREING